MFRAPLQKSLKVRRTLPNGRYNDEKIKYRVQRRHLNLDWDSSFNAIERQLSIVALAAAALVDQQHNRSVPFNVVSCVWKSEVKDQNRCWLQYKLRGGGTNWLVVLTGVLFLILGLGWFCRGALNPYFNRSHNDPISLTTKVAAERIISIESNNDPNATNSRSTAIGLGQFLNQTWLDLIRKYRSDLTKGRSESEILELRRDSKLVREITLRSVERTIALLKERGLPSNLASIYLAHFAGDAGAIAILSAPENSDVALVMANADRTGRITRSQIVKANPFLDRFTVADLKAWADRKMHNPRFNVVGRLEPQ